MEEEDDDQMNEVIVQSRITAEKEQADRNEKEQEYHKQVRSAFIFARYSV